MDQDSDVDLVVASTSGLVLPSRLLRRP